MAAPVMRYDAVGRLIEIVPAEQFARRAEPKRSAAERVKLARRAARKRWAR